MTKLIISILFCLSAFGQRVGGGTGRVPIPNAGGMVLLEQKIASNSTSLDFTRCIRNSYDQYQITIVNLLPSTAGDPIWFRVSTDGGSTYISSASYYWSGYAITWNTTGVNGSTAANAISLVGNQRAAAGAFAVNGTYFLNAPQSGNNYTAFYGHGFSQRSDNNSVDGYVVHGGYNSTTSVNAFRVMGQNGNIASGIVRCYGLAKQ